MASSTVWPTGTVTVADRVRRQRGPSGSPTRHRCRGTRRSCPADWTPPEPHALEPASGRPGPRRWRRPGRAGGRRSGAWPRCSGSSVSDPVLALARALTLRSPALLRLEHVDRLGDDLGGSVRGSGSTGRLARGPGGPEDQETVSRPAADQARTRQRCRHSIALDLSGRGRFRGRESTHPSGPVSSLLDV